MEVALFVFAIFSILAVVTGVGAAVAGIRRAQVTHAARQALPSAEGQTAAQVYWQVREVSESPHARAIADKQITSSDVALVKIEETLTALPPGHEEMARIQAEQLAHARAVRSATVSNLQLASGGNSRQLSDKVAEGLTAGLAGRELPAGHQHVRRAITADQEQPRAAKPAAQDRARNQWESWLGQFGVSGQVAAASSSALAQLADVGMGLAQGLIGQMARPSSTTAEGRRLLESMETLGAQVTPAYLWQITDYSQTALQNTTSAVHRLQAELAARNGRESFRRYWWPSVGDRIAEDTLAHGRAVLAQEHQAHRQLSAAMESLANADPQLRGVVWTLMLRELPPGAIDGPDLTGHAPALEAYLANQRGRR